MSEPIVTDERGRPVLVLARRLADEHGWSWTRARALQPGQVQVFAGQEMAVASVTVLGPRLVLVRYTDAIPREWSGSTEVAVRP